MTSLDACESSARISVERREKRHETYSPAPQNHRATDTFPPRWIAAKLPDPSLLLCVAPGAWDARCAPRAALAARAPGLRIIITTKNPGEAIPLAEPASVAVVNDLEIQRSELGQKVEALGHSPQYFCDILELMSALVCGQRFHLVLSSFRAGKTSWRNVNSVSEALHLPVLLVVQASGWPALRAKASNSQLVDIVASEMSESELGWRIDVLLKSARALPQEPKARSISFGDYRFLEAEHVVVHRGRPISLQPRQFGLAQAMFRNVGKIVSRDWLWASVWKMTPPQGTNRTIDVCVTNVRRRLDLRAENGFILRAAYKHGYILSAVDAASRSSEAPDRVPGGDKATRPARAKGRPRLSEESDPRRK
jgi:DNA-binding response OmpR family regulator